MDFKDMDSPGSCLILLLMKDPLVSPSARSLVRTLVTGACAMFLVTQVFAADSPREHLSLDANWKFHLGDDWPDALHLENSGTGSGPAAEKFADSYWRVVNLPHDWAVELPFDRTADGEPRFQAAGREVSDEQHRLVSPHV